MKNPDSPDIISQFRAKDDIFTPSNLISIMRAMFVLPAIFCIIASQNDTNMYFLVAAICVAAAATDILDGLIARRTDTVTEFGKIVDPLADKVFVGLVVITLVAYGLLPVWFFAAVIGRDLIILFGGWWAKRKLGVVLPSNYIGKIAVIVISFTILFIVIQHGIKGDTSILTQVVAIMEWASVVLMAASLWAYGQRLAGLLAVAK